MSELIITFAPTDDLDINKPKKYLNACWELGSVISNYYAWLMAEFNRDCTDDDADDDQADDVLFTPASDNFWASIIVSSPDLTLDKAQKIEAYLEGELFWTIGHLPFEVLFQFVD